MQRNATKQTPLSQWDYRFMQLAETISGWSKDPSTKCGAVIVDDKKRIISIGFNGFPQGVPDDPARYNNRELKYDIVLHAEQNAILFSHRSVVGTGIYTFPVPPCSRCAALIVQAGISTVTALRPDPERYERLKIATTEGLFHEAGVELRMY